MDRDAISVNIERWRRHLPFVDLHYAIKANNDPLVVEHLIRLGCFLDAASEYELKLATKLGANPDSLLLSHPAKSARTLQAIAEHRPWGIAVDTKAEIRRVAEVVQGVAGYSPTLFIRIAVKSENVQDDLSQKFGCSATHAIPLLSLAKSLGFEGLGVSFHVGTQCYDIANYRNALRIALQVIHIAESKGIPIAALDIGGGFCDERVAEAHGISHDRLFDNLRRLLEPLRDRYRLVAEPGRYVVADAGTLILSVISLDPGDAKPRQIIIDDHIYGALCGEKFDSRQFSFTRIDLPVERVEAPLAPWNVFGATCDSVDHFIPFNAAYHWLPDDLEIGDMLFVECMGAYSSSSGASFNGLDPAGVVLAWREGEAIAWEKSSLFRKSDLLLQNVRVTQEQLKSDLLQGGSA